MAKKKPDVHAKQFVATNAMFKNAVKKASFQMPSRHVKDAIEKPAKKSKSEKGYKPKHAAKPVPNHTLAAEFADNLNQSRETIEEKAIAALDATSRALSQRLVDSHDLFNQKEQDAIKVHDTIVTPLNEQELEWTSTDGKQSGKTMLGARMKKFQKTIEAEEKEVERQVNEWIHVQSELRQLALEIVGPDGLDSVLAGNFDPTNFLNAEKREMMAEIEAEQKALMERIEKAGREAVEAMTESEKKLELKQKKDEEWFLAILRGGE